MPACCIVTLLPLTPLDHKYEAPVSGLATESVRLWPVHIVVLPVADITGIGLGLTVTVIGSEVKLHPFALVIVAVKVPEAVIVRLFPTTPSFQV